MAGIKDVAKMAGVGVGTVSRMLNDSGYVSLDTRAKIEAAMKELNYTPNELARNLYYKKSGIIAVLVPNVSNPFFAEFVDCVEGELRKAGFKIMLCNTLKDVKAEAEYLDLLNRHIVDGIIAGMSSLDESEYSKIHKPIVALDRYLGEEIPVVAVDHKMGGRLAAEVLLRNGCKRILHFRSTAEKESLYHDRHAEFQKIMDEQGIETYCYDLDWRRLDIQYYHQVAEEVMEKNLKFDGVFGVDRLAIECMNGLLRQHKTLGFHHLSNQFRLITIFTLITIIMVLPHIRDVFQKQHGENEIFVSIGTDGAAEHITRSPQCFVDGVLVDLIGHLDDSLSNC